MLTCRGVWRRCSRYIGALEGMGVFRREYIYDYKIYVNRIHRKKMEYEVLLLCFICTILEPGVCSLKHGTDQLLSFDRPDSSSPFEQPTSPFPILLAGTF